MVVERRDRRIDRNTPVVGEFLGNLGVDVAIGPDDKVQLVDLARGTLGPRFTRRHRQSWRGSGREGRRKKLAPAQMVPFSVTSRHITPQAATEPAWQEACLARRRVSTGPILDPRANAGTRRGPAL